MVTLIETEMCGLIARNEGITGAQISQKLGVTRSAASQYIAKLIKIGCVRVDHDANNAKLKRVYLTDVGRETATLSLKYSIMMGEQMYSCSDEELEHYMNFVTKLERFHKAVVEMLMSAATDEAGPEASEDPGSAG